MHGGLSHGYTRHPFAGQLSQQHLSSSPHPVSSRLPPHSTKKGIPQGTSMVWIIRDGADYSTNKSSIEHDPNPSYHCPFYIKGFEGTTFKLDHKECQELKRYMLYHTKFEFYKATHLPVTEEVKAFTTVEIVESPSPVLPTSGQDGEKQPAIKPSRGKGELPCGKGGAAAANTGRRAKHNSSTNSPEKDQQVRVTSLLHT